MTDPLAPAAVEPLLSGRFGREVYRYAESCPSTQRLLEENDPEGTIAVAEEQTEGRGRLGRTWEAPAGTSILASILLRPAVEPARLPELSLVAGGAVAEAISEITGMDPTIKYPNDVLIRGRKVAGILAEASEGRVVLGIGVNVGVAPWPEAGAVEADRLELLLEILERLETGYADWLTAS